MPPLSLREAATASGTSKSTILRAIQSGRMSAPRNDDGGYDIDPAELFRVYPLKAEGDGPTDRLATSRDDDEGHDAPAHGAPDDVELRIRNARLEVELASMKALLEAERRRGEELREERDRWHTQAERFAIAAPVPMPAPAPAQVPQIPVQPAERRPGPLVEGVLRWLKRA